MTDPLLDLGLEFARSRSAALELASLDFHTGQIIAWDSDNNTNQVLVIGTIMTNLPILTSAGITSFSIGSSVGILRVRTQYFIVGRVVDQTTGLVNPQFPIVMYPQFRPNGAAGSVLYWDVPQTAIGASWEGRATISFPYIEVDGVWGCDPSPGNSATYELRVAGTVVGSWTETGVVVARRGPFDVQSFIGQNWARVDIRFSAFSGGATNVALQTLGCYFRGSN